LACRYWYFLGASYIRSFALFGKTAGLDFNLPYASGASTINQKFLSRAETGIS